MLLSDIYDVKDGRLITKDADFVPWIGVDLDGTLAEYHGFEGIDIIGKPIPKMVEYVRNLLKEGEVVKIFTARIHGHSEVISHIQQWLRDAGLPILEVTNVKDPDMTMLIDDKARQVVKNTGRFVTKDVSFQGIPITVENKPGSVRKGEDENGETFKTEMFYPYGEIDGTEGADGDPIDVFIGSNKDAENVFIIHSKMDGKYDEDKVMLGFDDELYARDAFCAHYDQPAEHLGPITKMSMIDFKKAIQGHKKGTRIK